MREVVSKSGMAFAQEKSLANSATTRSFTQLSANSAAIKHNGLGLKWTCTRTGVPAVEGS